MPTNACQFFYRCENCKTVFETKRRRLCLLFIGNDAQSTY
ncbi:hypothetical protein [Salegentibacter echinorum]|nr:hypothetical protein [Salegentibacter echinorum]